MKLFNKFWKKGAIFGGIFGVLPIILLFFSSKPCEPGMVGCNDTITYLRMILSIVGLYLSSLFYNLGILPGNWGMASYIPIILFNILGWILIGTILGLILDKALKRK